MKKESLTVDFVDFWPNFVKADNYFYHLLSQEFNVIITDKTPALMQYNITKSKKADTIIRHFAGGQQWKAI